MTTIRRMEIAELELVAEIDRSEHVREIYVNREGRLIRKNVDWQILRWPHTGSPQQAFPEEINPQKRTLPDEIALWRQMLAIGSTMLGAFEDKTLVGFSIYRPKLSPDTAQLAALYVSKDHRGQGIGALLLEKIVEVARADGAKKLYVSSTPTAVTVDFYMSNGFNLTKEINQHLHELEPDDIHMIKDL